MYSGRFKPLSVSLSASLTGNGLRTYAALGIESSGYARSQVFRDDYLEVGFLR